MKNFRWLTIAVFVVAFGFLSQSASVPMVELHNCEVPQAVGLEMIDGITGVLLLNAGTLIQPADLRHVHLVISPRNYAKLTRNSYTAAELMMETDGLLFHTQEFPSVRNLSSMLEQKRSNIYHTVGTEEVGIIDPDQYKLDRPYIVNPSEHLGYIETFEIDFERTPRYLDTEQCKLPRLTIRTSDLIGEQTENVVIPSILFTGARDGKFKSDNLVVNCSCSGAVHGISMK